jgi:Na+/proline symporter
VRAYIGDFVLFLVVVLLLWGPARKTIRAREDAGRAVWWLLLLASLAVLFMGTWIQWHKAF